MVLNKNGEEIKKKNLLTEWKEVEHVMVYMIKEKANSTLWTP